MPFAARIALLIGAAAIAVPALAERSTVCTITVNSADERDAFRRYLPEERYEFVELVERGRSDWLSSACRRQVKCDVLVVSGHFAGTEFYSSKFDVRESLPVDEIERAQCSESCPGLFGGLKEVYLFGCDTLKAEPVKSAMPEIVRGLVHAGQSRTEAERFARSLSLRHGESSRDLMRRLFPNVPAIYGFSSLAPYGRVAGPMLTRYLETSPADEFATGRPNERLLKLFGASSMTFASGLREWEPDADYRAESCRFYDDRLALAVKIATIREIMAGEMPRLRMNFDRIEKFLGNLDPGTAEVGQITRDAGARANYMAVTRETDDPALRVRMIALAREVAWLDAGAQRAELSRLIADMLRGDSMGYGEVDLVCTLNKDRDLDRELATFNVSTLPRHRTANAAALACLGNDAARASVLRAVASADESDVQIAQSYLRHRPMTEPAELRSVAAVVTRMRDTSAQIRALDTLGRHHIADSEVLAELASLFTTTKSPGVQRAIAEIFLRSGEAPANLASILKRHRLPSPGGQDLVDVLIRKLEGQPS
jgi:hypothetical protein